MNWSDIVLGDVSEESFLNGSVLEKAEVEFEDEE